MALFVNIYQEGHGTIGNTYVRRTKNDKGKVVNVVASKNFSPTNPRTYSQMTQRARFATAVKFYKRAASHFFKFAYEDQKPNESDYNCFMRHNVKSALPMNKFQVNSDIYPAIGTPWLLAQGSLVPLTLKPDGADFNLVKDGLPAITSSESTIGEFSDALKAAWPNQILDGDIITIVGISMSVGDDAWKQYTQDEVSSYVANLLSQGASVPEWNITQVIIGQDSDTLLREAKSIGNNVFNNGPLDMSDAGSWNFGGNDFYDAMAIVHTRKDGSGLLSSTSYLALGEYLEKAVSEINKDTYLDASLVSWGAQSADAILQGSVAGGVTQEASTATPIISQVNGNAIPYSQSFTDTQDTVTLNLTGKYFDSEKELTENSFTVTGGTVKSLTISSATTAILVIDVADPGISVDYNGTRIYSATFGKV